MIVYRVADGKGWTKNTYAEVSTRIAGSTIHLGDLSTLRAQSNTAFNGEDPVKSVATEIQVTHEVYMTKETNFSVEHV